MHALYIGFGLGFLVALQLGPMSLFLVRSTLRGGLFVGLAIGAGEPADWTELAKRWIQEQAEIDYQELG
mgnify:CR=1 FL=1